MMDNIPRQKLCEIISKYGRAICDDARRVEGLLRDLCGGYKRETSVLVIALHERVPQELLNTSSSGITPELAIARLSKRLHDDLAITEDAARWAVESWALALGVITAADVARFATHQAAVVLNPPLNQTITPSQNPPLNQTISPPQSPPLNQAVTPPQQQPFKAHNPNQSPKIRGFRLGMSLKQVLTHFNGLRVKPADEIGFQKVKLFICGEDSKLINRNNSAEVGKRFSPIIEGLTLLHFEFLDKQLISIYLRYDNSVKWNSIDEFVLKVSETIGLSGTWTSAGHEKMLLMKTYRIYGRLTNLGPTLRLRDNQASQAIIDRTIAKENHQKELIAAKENHQRQTFKL